MKVTKILSKATDLKKGLLVLEFGNGEVGKVDFSGKLSKWKRGRNSDLAKIAGSFGTAFVNDGTVCFKCGLKFDASDLYAKATFGEGKAKTIRPSHSSFSLGSTMSTDVMKVTSKGLPFTGIWREFLGEPEGNFLVVASSQPGMGKSTTMLKFANYLTKFGKPHYFSAEENYARLQRKLKLIGDKIHKFPMNDKCQCLQDIYDVFKEEGVPDFLFIDSLQRFGMDYDDIVSMRKKYPKMAIILICQETKSGKVRGDNRIIHEGDITISSVSHGRFKTDKNRFGELAEIAIFGDDTAEDEEYEN